jgi:glutamyl-tRNA synthetase
VELRNHPNENLGRRKIEITDRFYIALSDVNDLQVGDILRLMELFNIRIDEIVQEDNNKLIISSYHGDQITQSMKKIQWVSKKDVTEFSVTVPKNLFNGDSFNPHSLIIVTGVVESYILSMKLGTILQFVRFGFCKLSSYGSATYAHR